MPAHDDPTFVHARSWAALVVPVMVACSGSPPPTPPDLWSQPADLAPDNRPHARVFVTSATYRGSLKDYASAATGLLSADALCQQAALGAGLSGTFKAWLSDSTTNAVDRLQDVPGGWWTLPPSTTQVAASKASLIANGLMTQLYTDKGVLFSGCVWTGTLPDGTKATAGLNVGSDGKCDDWRASGINFAVAGGIGPYGTFNWGRCSSNGSLSYSQCQNSLPLYCFQQ